MFTCKICGSEVTRGQAYCSHCGADVVSNYEAVCPACGTLNGAGNRFCAHCGALLGVLRKPVCSICGAENLPGVKFCVVCGAPVVDFESPLTEQDVLEMRRNKMNVDLMMKERMRVADREIEQMKRKVGEDKARALKEIEDYRKKTNDEFTKQAKLLDAYREKVNELHTGGRYRYYVCPSENLEEVKARLGKIRNIVKDCFVIAIYKGNIISVAEARKIEQK